MDVPVSLENTPFMWGIAFFLDVATGLAMFSVITRKNSPVYTMGAAWWIGWWSWASAFTLIINMVVGTSNPFSYHQIGVLTESMTNLGLLWWILALQSKNWYMLPPDWTRMEILRAKLNHDRMVKSYKRKAENEAE